MKSSTAIFLGFWSKDHLATLRNNYFSCTAVKGCFQSFDKKVRQVKNQIIKHQIGKKN